MAFSIKIQIQLYASNVLILIVGYAFISLITYCEIMSVSCITYCEQSISLIIYCEMSVSCVTYCEVHNVNNRRARGLEELPLFGANPWALANSRLSLTHENN